MGPAVNHIHSKGKQVRIKLLDQVDSRKENQDGPEERDKSMSWEGKLTFFKPAPWWTA